MAKEQWNDGNKHYLRPAQMVSFFGDSASNGHTHDGVDVDGSVPKINLGDHTNLNWVEFGVDVSSTYFSTPVSNTRWDYALLDDIVFIHVKNEISGSHGTNTQFKFSPNGGNWPSAIVPTNIQLVGGLYLQVCAAGVERRMGSILIPASSTTGWELQVTDSSAIIANNNFNTASTQPKQIFRQIFKYRKQ